MNKIVGLTDDDLEEYMRLRMIADKYLNERIKWIRAKEYEDYMKSLGED